MGRFGRNKLTIKELLLCSVQMFLSATRMESCWSRDKTFLPRRKSIINNEEFKSWRQETHCGVIPWGMASHELYLNPAEAVGLIQFLRCVPKKELRVYLYHPIPITGTSHNFYQVISHVFPTLPSRRTLMPWKFEWSVSRWISFKSCLVRHPGWVALVSWWNDNGKIGVLEWGFI